MYEEAPIPQRVKLSVKCTSKYGYKVTGQFQHVKVFIMHFIVEKNI